jgi:hypothetical protein
MSRLRVTDAFEVMMKAGLEDPGAVAVPPPNVTDAAGKIRIPHWIIYPVPSAGGESSFSDPFELVNFEYQVTYVGTTRKQAEWLADAGRAVVVSRTPSGGWTHSLSLSVGYCADRSVSLFGGVATDAPGAFTVVDSYNLVVT